MTDHAGTALAKRERRQIRPGTASAGAGTVTEPRGTPSDEPGTVADRPGKATEHPGTAMADREAVQFDRERCRIGRERRRTMRERRRNGGKGVKTTGNDDGKAGKASNWPGTASDGQNTVKNGKKPGFDHSGRLRVDKKRQLSRLAAQLLDLLRQTLRLQCQSRIFKFKLLHPFRRQFIQHAGLLLRKLAQFVVGTRAQFLQ